MLMFFLFVVTVEGALGKIALNSIRRPKQSIVVNVAPVTPSLLVRRTYFIVDTA
jgi:hypothetical protein